MSHHTTSVCSDNCSFVPCLAEDEVDNNVSWVHKPSNLSFVLSGCEYKARGQVETGKLEVMEPGDLTRVLCGDVSSHFGIDNYTIIWPATSFCRTYWFTRPCILFTVIYHEVLIDLNKSTVAYIWPVAACVCRSVLLSADQRLISLEQLNGTVKQATRPAKKYSKAGRKA